MLQRFFQPNKIWQRAGDDVGGDVLEHDLCVKKPAGAGWVVGWILVWSAFDIGPRLEPKPTPDLHGLDPALGCVQAVTPAARQ